MNHKIFKKRRVQFLQTLSKTTQGQTLAVIFSGKTTLKNNDTTYPFRQNSDFYYLTGFHEDNAILVLTPNGKQKEHLFVHKKDPTVELWTGIRTGKTKAGTLTGIKSTFDSDSFFETLPSFFTGHSALMFDFYEQGELFLKISELMARASRKKRKTGMVSPEHLLNIREYLGRQRLIKDKTEIDTIKKAVKVTEKGYKTLLTYAKEAKKEKELQKVLEMTFNLKADGPAFESIIASGINGNVLHYIENNSTIKKDKLILIDAACEYSLYASDVSRTIPASGTFTKEQQEIYEIVLKALKEATAIAKPHATLKQIHDKAVSTIVDGLLKLKILTGKKKKIIEEELYKPYFPHGTSHWLGLDVHDNSPYLDQKGNPIALQTGMVFTIEPGLYLNHEKVPEKYRGIAVRIEDDILITNKGHEVLTKNIPKEVKEITDWMRRPFEQPAL